MKRKAKALATIMQKKRMFPRRKVLCLRPVSGRLVVITKGFLKLSNLLMLMKEGSLPPPTTFTTVAFGDLIIADLIDVCNLKNVI